MNARQENQKSVLTAFAALTIIAVFAWLCGSPILAVALDLGAMAALVVTMGGRSFHPGVKSAKHQS